MQKVCNNKRHNDIAHLHARTASTPRSEWHQREVLPVSVHFGVFSFHEPIGIERQWIVPSLGISSNSTDIHQQPGLGRDVVTRDCTGVNRFVGKKQGRRGMKTVILFAYTLNVLEVREIGFLHQSVIANHVI